jgi:hypothetical protein
VNIANLTNQAQVKIATINKQADVQVAGIQQAADEYVADDSKQAAEYSADQQLSGTKYSQDAETNRLQRSLDFAQDKWNQVWPLVSTFLQNPNQGQVSIGWAQLTAALGPAPWISQGGVWTPSQVQSQLNALYARSDQKTATDIHDAQIDLAGRGFAGSSPILDMLRFSYEAANVQSSVEGAQQLALQAAQANSEMILNQQGKRQDQWATTEATYAQLQKVAVDLTTGIFQSVASILNATTR